MKLAILHHHLNRGGVTQVIQNHLQALSQLATDDQPEKIVVLYDGQRDGWNDAAATDLPVELVVEPSLAYDTPDSKPQPDRLASAIEAALAKQGMMSAESLIHCHNHSLGKSCSLPGALERLSQIGWRQLLQVHDFAEDNRPANYRHLVSAFEEDPNTLGARLYPQATHLHYAALTERDASALSLVGVPRERLHILPNPAAEFADLPSQSVARGRVLKTLDLPASTKLIVYPVRGIRRKNVGEVLLLAAIAPDEVAFAITLAPKNPAERKSFDRWRQLAERLGLPCRFDTGGEYELGFGETLAAADALLTTSVAEGFGMVFLETWLAGRPLLGRDLPEVTREFRSAGMHLEGLWQSLNVPLPLFDASAVRDELSATHRNVCKAYGVSSLAKAELDSAIDALTAGGIDFARLMPERQAALVERAKSEPEVGKALREQFELDRLLTLDQQVDLIEQNAKVVQTDYSPQSIGKRLCSVYQKIRESPIGAARKASGGERLLRYYLAPDQLHAIRLES